eukprot:TRINITY_DN10421_c0_g1_i1.p1 TRINITY_DN10421_c0_g1~~TRINITY_DN10421_c0_g1_i1.p1  ORF type:complete len:495 (-),score=121.77 TRINITY_DN10421_c0_g1_i1:12-1496(-)
MQSYSRRGSHAQPDIEEGDIPMSILTPSDTPKTTDDTPLKIDFSEEPPPEGALTFEETIDHIGNGWYQYRLLVLCGCGWITDAFEMVMLSLLMNDLRDYFEISAVEAGAISSASFAGMLVGAGVWSIVADTLGRKPSFLFTVLTASIFGVASALAPSYWVFLVLRFLVGFGLGGNFPITYSMLIEFLAVQNRGLLGVILSAFWPIGVMMSSALAYFVMPKLGWRWLLGLSSAPGFLLLVARYAIPESPRYLASRGRAAEAWDVLRMVAKKNGKTFPSAVIESSIVPLTKTDLSYAQSIRLFISPEYFRLVSTFLVMWFLGSFGYFGVSTWLPAYMERLNIAEQQVYSNFIVVGFGQLMGIIGTALVVDKVGRKITLAALFFSTAVFSFLFGFCRDYWTILLTAIAINMVNNSATGVIYTITSEAFPTKVRSTSLGLCSVANKAGGILAPIVGGALYDAPVVLSFSIWAGSYLAAAILTFSLPKKIDAPMTRETG